MLQDVTALICVVACTIFFSFVACTLMQNLTRLETSFSWLFHTVTFKCRIPPARKLSLFLGRGGGGCSLLLFERRACESNEFAVVFGALVVTG